MEVSGQLHAPAALCPGNKPGTNWIGGRLDPRDGLDVYEKEKNVNIKILTNIIVTVVLYGCETWSLTLNKKDWRCLRIGYRGGGIFGPKRKEGTGGWRKLRSEKLHIFKSSTNTTDSVTQTYQISRSHLKTLGARRVTRSKFHSHNPPKN
jgi:hypothetical protein